MSSEGIGARDIWEVANQLTGYVDPSTPDDLADFLIREGKEAAKLADEIVRLRTALVAKEAEIAALRVALERIHRETSDWGDRVIARAALARKEG